MKEIMRRRRMRTYTVLVILLVIIGKISIDKIFSSDPLIIPPSEKKEPIDVESFDQEQSTINLNNSLILVNKENEIKSSFIPSDLVKIDVRKRDNITDEECLLKSEVAKALKVMFNDAEKEGVLLYASSGYRSYNTQNSIYKDSVNKNGREYADKYVATPGNSEHQTGFSMDITNGGYGLNESFENTKEGIWIKKNCYKYGFIIRYPKNKEKITGYGYEPWHVRYVGVESAKDIFEKGITLEEYLKK